MSVSHGFFLPDAEYCVDVEGMLHYLGEKVSSLHFYALDFFRHSLIFGFLDIWSVLVVVLVLFHFQRFCSFIVLSDSSS